MHKIPHSNKLTVAFFISILLFQLFPYQFSDAFVTNQLGSTLLGNSDISRIIGIGENFPFSATFDSSGNLWVADFNNHRVLMYPPANLVTGGAATVVLGQPNLSSNTANNGGLSATTLNGPGGLAFDSSGNLWVADEFNNRVLKYPPANLVTGGAATVVLGQTSFTASGSGTTATTLNNPIGLTFDSSGNLWVLDVINSRVLKYPPANLVTGGAATVVLGQTSFTASGSGTTATTLHGSHGLAFDSSGNLWVADSNNNRVLKYPPANLVTGGAATVVLGQTSFTASGSGTTATTLNFPTNVTFDSSGNLWVNDNVNHRVLMFPPANLVTGGAATVVLGQADMIHSNVSDVGLSATTLANPRSLAFDSTGNLWVSDSSNSRVIKYPPANLVTGGAATIAIGKPDLTSDSLNVVGVSSTILTIQTDITFDSSGNLWVADRTNHRVLKFPPANLVTGGAATVVLGQTSFTTSGSGTTATTLNAPTGLAFDSSGNL